MVAHQVVLDIDEWNLLEAVLDHAHRIRLTSEAGDYKGALGDSAPAVKLRIDLAALLQAAKAARPSDDREVDG
jgi:hypothetical protein